MNLTAPSIRALPHFAVVLALLSACSGKTDEGKTKDPVNGTDAGKGEGPAEAHHWTMMGYDVQSTFHNTAEKKITVDNVASLTKIWETPKVFASGAPAVVGDTVYATGTISVTALNAADGTVLWSVDTTDGPMGSPASPAYDDGVLYFVTPSGGILRALDTKNKGAELWNAVVDTHPQTTGYSSCIVVGDLVVVGDNSTEEAVAAANATFKGAVVAYDKKTGEEKWRAKTAGDGENGCSVWSTVSIDPVAKVVFAGTGNNYTENAGPNSDSIFAFNLDTGEKLWSKQVTEGDVFTIVTPKSPDSDFGANPVVFDVGDRKLVAGGQKSGDLYVLDRGTGEIVQHRKLGPNSALTGGIFNALSFDGTHLLTVANLAESQGPGTEMAPPGQSAALMALDPLTLDVVWERGLAQVSWNTLTIANGVGFVGIDNKLQAFNVADGTKLAEWEFPGTLTGGAAISNGRVFLQSGLRYIVGKPDDKLYGLALP